MINLRSSLIALLVLLWLQASLAVANTDPQLLKEPDEIVDVCELKKDPSRFAGKSFRLRAVLVENRTPRVDGGDSYLYGPRCRKSSLSIVVHFLSEEGYQQIGVLKPDHRGYVRANVVLLGVLQLLREPEVWPS